MCTRIRNFGWLGFALILFAIDHVRPQSLANTTSNDPDQYTLPRLPYDYGALEPVLSKEILQTHHQWHHGRCLKALNRVVRKNSEAIAARDLPRQILLQGSIARAGGCHVNHSLLWKILQPVNLGGGILKDGPFAQAVKKQFGSFDKLKAQFTEQTLNGEGSGWMWLAFSLSEKNLVITSTSYDTTIIEPLIPIIGLDMWEHAYYLQYKERKDLYLEQLWKIINYDEANRRYIAATASKIWG